MKFLFLTSGRHVPSTRFRMLPLAHRLREQGHACTLSHSFPEKYDYFPWLGFRPSQWLKRTLRRVELLRVRWGRYDAVILERELFDNPTWDLEAALRRVAKTLVLDIDDGVFLKFPQKFERLLELSDLVVVGNRLLADWAAATNPQVVIIPTCIDTDVYRPGPNNGIAAARLPVIGWMGTAGNVAYLRDLATPLRNLARRHEFEFQVIAGERGVLDELPLQGVRVVFRKWDPATEATDIRDFDIGVMPLSDDPWSRYKCGLKLLQYMAVGVPGVASPVGVNRDIVAHGDNGYLAATADEWEATLGELLASPELRQRMGQAARQTVEQRYSLAVNLPRWLEAVRRAVDRVPPR
jgi:glycosyltransferase involved in cell wall biosynthesis